MRVVSLSVPEDEDYRLEPVHNVAVIISPEPCPACHAHTSSRIELSDLDAEDQCEDGRMFPETCTMIISCAGCGEIFAEVERLMFRQR